MSCSLFIGLQRSVQTAVPKHEKRGQSPRLFRLSERSDQSVDRVIDVVVGDHTGITLDAVIGFDVGQSLDIPGGGELKCAVDLIETCDQVVVERACATSHQGVGDVTQVVADVARALGLATGIGGVVVALQLGGVGVLGVDRLGGAIDELVGLGGEGLGGRQCIGRFLSSQNLVDRAARFKSPAKAMRSVVELSMRRDVRSAVRV